MEDLRIDYILVSHEHGIIWKKKVWIVILVQKIIQNSNYKTQNLVVYKYNTICREHPIRAHINNAYTFRTSLKYMPYCRILYKWLLYPRCFSRSYFFQPSSRIRVDLLSYNSKPTNIRGQNDWRAEKSWTGFSPISSLSFFFLSGGWLFWVFRTST